MSAVWSCGSRCRLATSSRTNHTGPAIGLRWIHQPKDERVQPETDERPESLARVGRACEKEPAAALASPTRRRSSARWRSCAGRSMQRVGHHVQRRPDAHLLIGAPARSIMAA